ncbi:GNAT family N-acetyltransferase [Mucilaginibacter sp. UYCu711]|uniref:GNAT family N-acetyltransferase n=1 Tax=Mucilaginibacter sp. UYCu711 TaxID=3156339 RepID=UPI003D1A1FBE
MSDHQISVLAPDECSPAQVQQFHELVISGGQVQADGLVERILSAALLAFAYSGEELAGIASVKQQKRNYVTGIFLKAKVPRLAVHYLFEIGYAVTHEHFRRQGISRELIKELIGHKPGTRFYATTKDDGMRDLLTKSGFKKTGNSWLNVNEETLDLYTL